MTEKEELSQLKEQLGYFFMIFNASANDAWTQIQTTHSILSSVDVLLTLTDQSDKDLSNDIKNMYDAWERAMLLYEDNAKHKVVRLEMSRIVRRCSHIAAAKKLIKLTKDIYQFGMPQTMIKETGLYMGGEESK